ncbi:hypothetical protein Bhyg_03999, partial [Pseudolycoriella hygida]
EKLFFGMFQYSFQRSVCPTSYAMITQSGYGRIDDTSTFSGLCANYIDNCVVIIVHCARLKRTVLISTTPIMSDRQTFLPMFDWIVAKNEEESNKFNSFEVAVLRGYTHSELCADVFFFVQELNRFLMDTYEGHYKSMENNVSLNSSSFGAVLVDKGSALITIPEEPMDTSSCRMYSTHQMFREIFANEWMAKLSKGKITIRRHLQFDEKLFFGMFQYSFQRSVCPTSYAMITQSGYGRIDDTSIFSGLCVNYAITCVVIIGHCARLKRTVLINTQPIMSDRQTFLPIFDWIVAKNEEESNKLNSFEVAVLRGYMHSEFREYNFLFMRELNCFLMTTYEGHYKSMAKYVTLNSSSFGAVLVDKGSALITIPEEPLDTSSCRMYSTHQMFREIFTNEWMPKLSK